MLKGYKQKPGIDYFEVFAPISRMETIRMILFVAAQNKWNIHHLDAKLAFLIVYLKRKYILNNHLVLLRKEARITFIVSRKHCMG